MAAQGDRYDGILQGLGRRFTKTPATERGNILSTAAANTDFLDSLPIRRISRRSDFSLRDLRYGRRPTTIYLVLPAGNLETHFRWLRLIIQQALNLLEKFGIYPPGRLPILFLMEEFATLGHMPIMQRAAAYFPGFGVKPWIVLQDLAQLEDSFGHGARTIIGNAGLVQAFATNDERTLRYIKERLGGMMETFELRTALSRSGHGQLLMIEGMPPAVLARLELTDVANIKAALLAQARQFGQAMPRLG
jgi:type IV secretion system protein VirD4